MILTASTYQCLVPDACAQSITNWTVPAVTVLGGALLGFIASFVTQLIVGRRQSKKTLSARKSALQLEITAVTRIAGERAAATGLDIEIDAPLPTEAWVALQRTTEFSSIPRSNLEPIEDFYATVAAVNYRAALAPHYLLMAAVRRHDDVAQVYEALADQATGKSFEAVATQSAAATAAATGDW